MQSPCSSIVSALSYSSSLQLSAAAAARSAALLAESLCMRQPRLPCSAAGEPESHALCALHQHVLMRPAGPAHAAIRPGPAIPCPCRLGFGSNQLWQPFLGLAGLALAFHSLGYLMLSLSKPKYLPLAPAKSAKAS